jgi:four helix bundle protein
MYSRISMKQHNIIQEKSFAFALSIVNACRMLSGEKKEFVLSKQLLKCGTSIGANVEEAIGAQSKADFIAKLSIAYKEARETGYWIRLLKETQYLSYQEAKSLLSDIESLKRIIAKIRLTTMSNLQIKN